MKHMDESSASEQLNGYRFTTLRSLRVCLRSYTSLRHLAQGGDFTSAAILLDLTRALGDDPMSRVRVLTTRQKQAITLHLIRDVPVKIVAAEMGIEWRVVYLLVNAGLKRLLQYLQHGTLPSEWQQWQRDYVRRNAHLPQEELAATVGRTVFAVRTLIYKMRKSGEIGGYRGRVTSAGPQAERAAS